MRTKKEDKTLSKVCGCVVHFLGRDVVSITKCGAHYKAIAHTPTIEESKYFGISQYRITYKTKAEAEKHLRAVNAHEELVSVLELVDFYFKALDQMQPNKNHGEKGNSVRQAVAKAIAKAEARS